MVEDPVAKVRFPDFAAGATLKRHGQTYYFIGEETRKAFEQAAEAAERHGADHEIEEVAK
jgi:YHS domain-containing protein